MYIKKIIILLILSLSLSQNFSNKKVKKLFKSLKTNLLNRNSLKRKRKSRIILRNKMLSFF